MTDLRATSFNPRRILVRGVNWLGDAVMSTPALQRLRERFPHAEVVMVTHQKLASLYYSHPSVDRVQMFQDGEALFTMARWLRHEEFDVAVVLPNSPRSALETFLARVPVRLGYARPLRSWMLTHRVHDRANLPRMRKRTPAKVRALASTNAPRKTYDIAAHHVHHYLHLVAALGCDPAPVPPLLRVEEEVMSRFREKIGVAPRTPLFGLNAGAEYGPAKRWPEERFVETAIEIHRATNCCWLIVGGRGDRKLAGRIAQQIASGIGGQFVRNVAGETSLLELCAALKLCDAVLTNDTGPMHAAAALGTPVVVPFGSTSPELTGPGLPGDPRHQLLTGNVPCAPCFLRECPIDFRCMNSISVAEVASAMIRAARLHAVTEANNSVTAPSNASSSDA